MDEKGHKTDELVLTSGDHAQMLEKIEAFPPQFKQLCVDLMTVSSKYSTSLPPMKPTLVLVNFYQSNSKGLYWHRDNSLQEKKSAKKGTPVICIDW